MKVYFVGAGPGAPDLITLRGAQILARVPMVLYAGSLVSREMLTHCRADAEIIDTATLNLDEQEANYIQAREKAWGFLLRRGCCGAERRAHQAGSRANHHTYSH